MEVYNRLSWMQVRSALNNIYRCKSYYVGGSLCIDMAQGYSVVLNRNGRGFAFILGKPGIQHFLMPKDVEVKVNSLYKEIKGEKNHTSSVPV